MRFGGFEESCARLEMVGSVIGWIRRVALIDMLFAAVLLV